MVWVLIRPKILYCNNQLAFSAFPALKPMWYIKMFQNTACVSTLTWNYLFMDMTTSTVVLFPCESCFPPLHFLTSACQSFQLLLCLSLTINVFAMHNYQENTTGINKRKREAVRHTMDPTIRNQFSIHVRMCAKTLRLIPAVAGRL